MFLNKEEVKKELHEKECWKSLTPKEKKMFLVYVTNGLDEVEAYNDIYVDEDASRVIKFPAVKASQVTAKEDWQECFQIYAEVLQEVASVKTNAHLYNQYVIMATYNILDYVDMYGAFKFKTIEEAKEKLGVKALAIVGFDVSVHPRDPKAVMTVPKLADRMKAMDKLSKFSKFFGEQELGGSALSSITVNTSLAEISIEDDDKKRAELKLVDDVKA